MNCCFPECQNKASVYCECSKNKYFLCVSHLNVHTSLPGSHVTKRINSPGSVSNAIGYVRCEGSGCSGQAKVICGCNSKNYCLYCLDSHLLDSAGIVHKVEVRYNYTPNYEDLLHPLELLLSRAQCDASVAQKIKARNITVKDLLSWDLRTLNGMTDALGLSTTIKFLLWEEINYIRIVTERVYLKNDYMAKLVFNLEDDSIVKQEENT